MPLLFDSVGKGVMFSGCLSVHSNGYWTAWAISVKLTGNIH